MTFSATAILGQETIGLRMEYVALDPDIRKDALNRLTRGRDPMAVAYALTDGHVVIDIFRDEIYVFAGKLDMVMPGEGRGGAYLAAEPTLDPDKRDTAGYREHVRDFWEQALTANPALANQISQAFIQALNKPQAIEVRWGQPAVTGKPRGSAEYAGGQVVMTINPPAT